MTATGYAHPAYAASLAEFGEPILLPRSGGWLIRRPIKGSDESWDAIGPYPMFECRKWGHLEDDLSRLADDLVGVVVVPDPFGSFDERGLRSIFDRVHEFKTHFVADLRYPPEEFVRKSHQYHARRSLRSVVVDVCENPLDQLDDWMHLYEHLARRHGITGMRAFSKSAFEQQLRIPGLVMFRARAGDSTVGLDLWYVQRDVAIAHLAAFSDLGYRLRTSYATKWTALKHFGSRVRWMNLTGISGNGSIKWDGLADFKSGWSTDTRTTYLCERILQPEAYNRLSAERNPLGQSYAPSYRAGESS
jgi:hypothetical protein